MNGKMILDTARDWFGFSPSNDHDGHGQGHAHDGSHGHTHGVINPTIATTARGIWAIKWSFVILAITAALQIVVVLASSSVALLADTIHNVADATTAIPLWIAFLLARRKPTATFTYGYGRVEDLAGIAIVFIILFSALVAGYEAIDRLIHPLPISLLSWVAVAGLTGFIGNEIVAVLRIRVGREINSAALIADGYHARTDGLTSLAVVGGALGVWLGFPLADPIIGLLITIVIFGIVWQSARSVLTRMLDGVDPALVGEIHHAAEHVSGVRSILDVKARWLGHRLHADLTVVVDDALSMVEADRIGEKVKQEMFSHITALAVANVRVHGCDPGTGEAVLEGHQDGHHHAPGPFRFASPVAGGLLEIIDTPDGERMRLSVERPVKGGMTAIVSINRADGKVETLALMPVVGNNLQFISVDAPAEPHEFEGRLHLRAGGLEDMLPFRMAEPKGHSHAAISKPAYGDCPCR